MPRKLLFLVSLFLVGICATVQAQSTPATQVSLTRSYQEKDAPSTEHYDDDWTFYSDSDNKRFYIDFEDLRVNLNDIIVKDARGEVVLKENVFDLPVNTIYELDFANYQPGLYLVELRSFTGVLRKEIQLN